MLAIGAPSSNNEIMCLVSSQHITSIWILGYHHASWEVYFMLLEHMLTKHNGRFCYFLFFFPFYHRWFPIISWHIWAFCLTQPSTQVVAKPHLQKMLSHRHPCHTWNSWLERPPCEVVSPNSFHALNGWDCTDGPQMTRDLRNLVPMWTAPFKKRDL
jgi:hypothetical protein